VGHGCTVSHARLAQGHPGGRHWHLARFGQNFTM